MNGAAAQSAVVQLKRTEACPCPFCGVYPSIQTPGDSVVVCCWNDDCKVHPTVKGNSREEALGEWNLRDGEDNDATPGDFNLAATFNRSFATLIGSGKIEKMIDARLETLVQELITEATRSFGEFGERLKKTVAAALAIGDFTLPQYGERVTRLVETIVEGEIETSFNAGVKERLTELLTDAPKEITLSKLCEEFAEQARCYEEDYEKAGNEWTLVYEQSSNVAGHYELGLDEDAGKKLRSCEIQLRLSRLDGSSNRYEVWGLIMDGEDVSKKLFIGPEYGFAKQCWQMYAAKTVLVFDEEPDRICTMFPHPGD